MIFKKQSQVFMTLLFFVDQTILWGSWLLAYWTRFHLIDYPQAESIAPFAGYFEISWVVVLFGAVTFIYARMYHPKRIFHYRGEAGAILRANLLLWMALLGASFFYRGFSFSRVQSLHFLLISLLLISAYRGGVRYTLAWMRTKGRNLRYVLVIGASNTASMIVSKIRENPGLGLVMRGYLAKQPNEALGLEYLGNYPNIPEVIHSQGIDQVFVALDSDQQSDLGQINQLLAEETVDFNLVPDIYHSLAINPEFLDLDGMPIIALRQSPVDGWNRVIKRAFDIAVALCSILVMTPFWVVLPLLIKLTSRGPVFYRQTRMGLDGKSFDMLKFRSMRTDAEASTGAVWAQKDDPRVTRIGALMRRTSLDEIPQLFNVLGGSMSIVGPRPERPELIGDFKKEIPNYMLRHKIKAGLTGWAQINGWRGNTSLEKRIEYDIYYLTHWSIWFDLKIFLLSLFKGFIDPNAY
ncbi:MAG: undecaprenyl-phosphate glucose phosphotransferase [bacterium]|nr:undecaprenyl-phosphate glucose phosphotransferase [bacterium]